jgi:ABC-type Fe3+/spermidine/putrescine transport system ATPase subunit
MAGPQQTGAGQAGASAAVELVGLSVGYGATPIVREVSLAVAAAETLVVLGPSGAGKTTLLYAIAGFLDPSAGAIRLAGREVATPRHSVPPEQRGVAMVFQHYGLWPHLDALATVAYPLRRQGLARAAAEEQALSLLARLHIEHLAARRPAELSGGEQQRVGLARALARRPQVYLLDEPTAHLDATLRAELQEELALRRADGGAAAIHATHDVEEALALADRVALLRDGTISQVGTPADVYNEPRDAWAARLTGPASFVTVGGAQHLVRPDWIDVGAHPAAGAADSGTAAASVESVRFRGTHTDLTLVGPHGRLLARVGGPPTLSAGALASYRIRHSWPLPEVGPRNEVS